MLRVVMVEDDTDLLDEMGFNLRQQGFQVTLCANGKDFEQVLHLGDGQHLELTRSETLLLSRLARATGQQATRQQLVEALGENYRDYDPRRLEAIISRLRQKLTRAGITAEALRAIRHTGYILTVPISERDSIAR